MIQQGPTALFWLACVARVVAFVSSYKLNSVMPHNRQIHSGDPAYASPVIRPPSPASSVGTAYGPDETSLSDSELAQDTFERKWTANLRLNEPKDEEVHNLKDVLVTPPSDPGEQKCVSDNVVSPVPVLIA